MKAFLWVSGVIFLLVAVVHLLRLLLKWEVLLAGFPAPLWDPVVLS